MVTIGGVELLGNISWASVMQQILIIMMVGAMIGLVYLYWRKKNNMKPILAHLYEARADQRYTYLGSDWITRREVEGGYIWIGKVFGGAWLQPNAECTRRVRIGMRVYDEIDFVRLRTTQIPVSKDVYVVETINQEITSLFKNKKKEPLLTSSHLHIPVSRPVVTTFTTPDDDLFFSVNVVNEKLLQFTRGTNELWKMAIQAITWVFFAGAIIIGLYLILNFLDGKFAEAIVVMSDVMKLISGVSG